MPVEYKIRMDAVTCNCEIRIERKIERVVDR